MEKMLPDKSGYARGVRQPIASTRARVFFDPSRGKRMTVARKALGNECFIEAVCEKADHRGLSFPGVLRGKSPAEISCRYRPRLRRDRRPSGDHARDPASFTMLKPLPAPPSALSSTRPSIPVFVDERARRPARRPHRRYGRSSGNIRFCSGSCSSPYWMRAGSSRCGRSLNHCNPRREPRSCYFPCRSPRAIMLG